MYVRMYVRVHVCMYVGVCMCVCILEYMWELPLSIISKCLPSNRLLCVTNVWHQSQGELRVTQHDRSRRFMA